MDRYMGCSQNHWPLLVIDSILAQFGGTTHMAYSSEE